MKAISLESYDLHSNFFSALPRHQSFQHPALSRFLEADFSIVRRFDATKKDLSSNVWSTHSTPPGDVAVFEHRNGDLNRCFEEEKTGGVKVCISLKTYAFLSVL